MRVLLFSILLVLMGCEFKIPVIPIDNTDWYRKDESYNNPYYVTMYGYRIGTCDFFVPNVIKKYEDMLSNKIELDKDWLYSLYLNTLTCTNKSKKRIIHSYSSGRSSSPNYKYIDNTEIIYEYIKEDIDMINKIKGVK